MTVFSMWLDQPGAKGEAEMRATGDEFLIKVASSIIDDGFCIINDIASIDALEGIVSDYNSWVDDNAALAQKHRDPEGRHFRLANLHVYSDSAQRLIKSDRVMRVLDFLFGRKAMVYTSLTFEYSTEQRAHRDTPHFYTDPEGLFMGVWFPLEDVNPDAGPLCYYPGSHRIDIDQTEFLDGDPSDEAVRMKAIDRYQTRLREICEERYAPIRSACLKRGQMAIWHPQLVHGGSIQNDPWLTRRSMVFHVAPEATPVYKSDVFFGLPPSSERPYEHDHSYSRAHARRDRPSFMNAR